ncbi:MAG: tRNA (adenosine(37)-N6)-dimethylallyltransferase MiaA [Candidatus Abyssobacteria bacterium SURF_17]|uniref:tRNA dimethylallyltransferase n=1 Tax=Candidatus Abyssobacteria bacterium SURF_17 TaxID=2093361 RepID=A0A419EV79_9BACT|nr:MAG: tRNA (adenosine(37)-N6)-dimethylallyltransferase MiaA [Candidatus Abyssubacteria bacterium SURF_17]
MPDFLVVCGPTASGKSNVAVLLAEALGGEIISADSMQIYRGLDIGTDKPSAELRKRVPHHMIDVVEPQEGYSAARYEREAVAVVDRLLGRGKIPIVVGGSGLYIRVLINGIFPAPPASVRARNRLRQEAEEKGVRTLYERLAAVDPDYARVAAATDLRRIVRALEVFELTGSPFSAWHRRHREERPPRDAFLVGLRRSREDLYRRIDTRVDEMFSRGLVDEVRHLCERGYADALKHLRPLGYIEVIDYLEGRADLEEAVRLVKRNSRRYAKRQQTWFRKEAVRWVDLDPADEGERARNKIIQILPGRFGT